MERLCIIWVEGSGDFSMREGRANFSLREGRATLAGERGGVIRNR